MKHLLAGLSVLLIGGCGGDATPPRPAAPPPPPEQLTTRPDLRPPPIEVETAPSQPDGSLVFISPRLEDVKRDGREQQQGAMALDARGRTVWWRPVEDAQPVTDVRVQRYRGQPVLTWWQGAASDKGIGSGRGVIVDRSYREIASVRAGSGESMDLHEFLLTPRGTAIVCVYSRARQDLTSLGRAKDALVTQGIVQEIDIETGRVLFEWKSLDHVDPEESVEKLPDDPKASWDYFHINSIAEDGPDHLLISARNTSAIYRIERRSGEVDWRLGGKRSDFRMGPGTQFGLQHDARRLPDGTLQLFDNTGQKVSKVKVLRLRGRRAELVRELAEPDGMQTETQGNAHRQADGGVMVGWGSAGAISLFDAGGGLRFDAHLPAEYDTYRAYRDRWVGRPAVRPQVRAERDSGQVTVTASWNGATEVRRWQVLAGTTPESLREVGAPADWRDLETTIVRMTDASYVAVAALDARGRTLATSAAVKL